MIRKSSLVAAIFLMLIFAFWSYASNGTQIGTIGGRSTAMGSAFRGLSDDWSAVFFNPAGLTQLGKLTIGASGGTIMPRGSYTAAPYSFYPTDALITSKADLVSKNFFVPALGVFYKPSEKLVFGLGVFAPFGLGTEFNLIKLPAEYGNSTGISKENEHYSDHKVITIQPTIAYQISDKLSVGIGASYITGSMTIDQVVMALNPFNATVEVAPGVSITKWQGLQSVNPNLPALTAVQNRVAVQNNLDGDGSALGVNIGLLYKVNEKLSIGLSGRYCTDLKLEGTIDQTKITFGDAAKAAALNDIPSQAFGGDANKLEAMGLFSGANYTDPWDIKANLPLPITAGLGLAYKANDRLTVTADASWTNWATWDEIVVESQEEGYDDLIMKQEWKNTIEIGAGAEYQATKCLSVLAGLYTAGTPSPDETISPTILDPIRRWVLTGGLGYKLGNVALNLTGEWVMFGDKELTSADYEYDPDTGVPDNYAGLYQFNAYVVTLAAQISLK